MYVHLDVQSFVLLCPEIFEKILLCNFVRSTRT